MKLKSDRIGRLAACAGLLLAAALLASCGGGGTVVNVFVANRVIAFGDENSVIDKATGGKYTVNAVEADLTTINCIANPIWVQTLAARYGLVFDSCNPLAEPAPVSRIYATPGAKVADLAGQIALKIKDGGFTNLDMVTILVGGNDVKEQFERYERGEIDLATATAILNQVGLDLAVQLNYVATLGPRVIISTVPSLGLTPYAGRLQAGVATTRSTILTNLTAALNNALIGTLNNNGHLIGLIQINGYLVSQDNALFYGGGSYVNTTLGACLVTAPLPTCTTQTLKSLNGVSANGTTWLWADDLHLSAGGQSALGSLANTLAQNNPF